MIAMHLTLDAYGADKEKLSDVGLVTDVLTRMPDDVGMTKISEPMVVNYKAGKDIDSGISGVILIAESHISIHTFPARGYFSFDLFSCREFDAAKIVQFIKGRFGAGRVVENIMRRTIE
ncbi:MAG: adenosylmethionine decarboxylase [archaeon]